MTEDNDIKIFTAKPKDNSDDDLIALAEELRRQVLNGNTPKAKELGRRLALFSPESDDLGDELKALMNNRSITLDLKLQLKILMLFANEYALYHSLRPMVATTATEAMYDRLRKEAEIFYRNAAIGTAFTFYRLAAKKDDVPAAMGENFAQMCDSENNQKIKDLGKAAFELTCARVNQLISECDFVD